MKPLPISQSPFAHDPAKQLTEEERQSRYHEKLDGSRRTATVLDVITGTFHRNLTEDLSGYIAAHPWEFQEQGAEWTLTGAAVKSLDVRKIESFFFQDPRNFAVDLLSDADIRLEEIGRAGGRAVRRYSRVFRLRLRYRFDFCYCELRCALDRVIVREEESLARTIGEGNLPMTRYLLPVLKSEDCDDLAVRILAEVSPESLHRDGVIDPFRWAEKTGKKIRWADFRDAGTSGEFFFHFGTADLVDERSGLVRKDAEINPGTILLNRKLGARPAMLRSTLTHELIHSELHRFFFFLQQCATGNRYSAYVCKRLETTRGSASPFDIMEIQANMLPRFLLIPTRPGRRQAERCLESLGGERNLETMKKLVDFMAEHYQVTRTMARSRLEDFGYREARGIMRQVNNSLIPSYLSDLPNGLSYEISEESVIGEYLRSPRFRELMESGLFVYAQGHCVLNSPRYVRRGADGRPALTRTARENMAGCCLVFHVTYRHTPRRYPGGAVCKSGKAESGKSEHWNGELYPIDEAELAVIAEAARQSYESKRSFQTDFNDMTVALMKRNGLTLTALSDLTGLSRETIKRMRGKPDQVFEIRSVLALCFAFHLLPEESKIYIDRSPAKLLMTEEMEFYHAVLTMHPEKEVWEVNQMALRMGYAPLTELYDPPLVVGNPRMKH